MNAPTDRSLVPLTRSRLRALTLFGVPLVFALSAGVLVACSSDDAVVDPLGSDATGPDASASSSTSSSGGSSSGTPGENPAPGDASADSASDASGAPSGDGGGSDGGGADDGGGPTADAGHDAGPDASSVADAGAPGLLTIGRFDVADPAHPRFAWPGARIVARFDGTQATAVLSHAPGSQPGGTSWVNVVVDGVPQAPQPVSAAMQTLDLTPGGLAAGEHTVEIEKRTEANIGTLRLESLTFAGGTGLLAPPPRPTRRIEFVSESTLNGFGVEGKGPNDPGTCNGGAPDRYNDSRRSIAWFSASALSAEHHLVAFSGKGVARNNDLSTNDTMLGLWTRTLPESAASAWPFASWTPDVVVISLGGADFNNGSLGPAGFPATYQAKYLELVSDVRARYGTGPWVILTVWSQLKAYNNVRQTVTTALSGVVSARKAIDANERTSVFSLPEAAFPGDETGCYFHANEAHHKAMSDLLVAEIRQKTGW